MANSPHAETAPDVKPTEPATDVSQATPVPMNKGLVIAALISYGVYLAFVLIRTQYATCGDHGSLTRGWQLADGITAAVVGAILSTVAKGALDASDIPQEVKFALENIATAVQEVKDEQRTVVQDLRERRASQWVSPFGDGPQDDSSPTPPPPVGSQGISLGTPEASPEGGALTTREFVLSSGHHVRAKVRREH